MGLLFRYRRVALLIALSVALFLVSSTWSPHGSGLWPAATPAWAGGSPDETLNPPTQPPGKATTRNTDESDLTAGAKLDSDGAVRTAPSRGRTWLDRWTLVWRLYWTSRLRV
jgi:hypothetical protein